MVPVVRARLLSHESKRPPAESVNRPVAVKTSSRKSEALCCRAVVTLRVVATVAVETLRLPRLEKGGRHNPQEAVMYTRRTVFDDGTGLDTPRYRREALLAQDTVSGPALVIQHNSTTLIPPGYLATVLNHGDMLIARTNDKAERAA